MDFTKYLLLRSDFMNVGYASRKKVDYQPSGETWLEKINNRSLGLCFMLEKMVDSDNKFHVFDFFIRDWVSMVINFSPNDK